VNTKSWALNISSPLFRLQQGLWCRCQLLSFLEYILVMNHGTVSLIVKQRLETQTRRDVSGLLWSLASLLICIRPILSARGGVVKGGEHQGGYKRNCYAGHKHDHRKERVTCPPPLLWCGDFVFRDWLMSAYGNLVYWRGSLSNSDAVYLVTKRLTTNGVPVLYPTCLF
jgi:hypothetical protein